jgi:hypothetical protein
MLPYIGVEMLFHRLVNSTSTSTALDTAREVLTPPELGAVRLNQWVIRGGAGGLSTPLCAGAGEPDGQHGSSAATTQAHAGAPTTSVGAHRSSTTAASSAHGSRDGHHAWGPWPERAHGGSATPNSGACGSRCVQHAWEPRPEWAQPQLRRTRSHRLEIRRPRANPVVGAHANPPVPPLPCGSSSNSGRNSGG